MTPHETNGRIKMTWPQLVWGISMLLMLAGMWTRMEVRMALIEAGLCTKAEKSTVDALLLRMNAITAPHDAQAGPVQEAR